MTRRDHWERTYESKPVDRLGWYAPNLETSLDWIKSLHLAEDSPIIDVGCGASTLVDDLLSIGYRSITAVDISTKALSTLQERLGQRSDRVEWLAADITTAALPNQAYELWHDRAVFHFLTEAEDREAYRRKMLTSLKSNAYVIIGTFAPEAPAKCSGLPVARYEAEQLADALGAAFTLMRDKKELHVTPGGVEQMYQYCLFQKTT